MSTDGRKVHLAEQAKNAEVVMMRIKMDFKTFSIVLNSWGERLFPEQLNFKTKASIYFAA